MTTRILMTGSRGFNNADLALTSLQVGMMLIDSVAVRSTLVHGAARGADLLVAGQAERLGMTTEAHPAQWNQHSDSCPDWDTKGDRCKLAGFRRNTEMIHSNIDLCLAFPMHPQELAPGQSRKESSRGTWHCVDEANKAGVATVVVWGNKFFPYGELGTSLVKRFAEHRGAVLDSRGALSFSELRI